MARIVLLTLAACAMSASALNDSRQKAFLGNGMKPDVVARMLTSVENEWKEQAHVQAVCQDQQVTSYEGIKCKEAPQAFFGSCKKVVGAMYQSSTGNPKDTKEYMDTVCNEAVISKGWHHATCKTFEGAVVDQMSVNDAANREEYALRSQKACDHLWTHFVEEQQVVLKNEAAEKAIQDEKDAKAALEEKKRLEAKHQEELKQAAEAAAKAKAEEEAEAKAAQKRLEEEKAKEELKQAAEAAAKAKAEEEAEAKAAQKRLEEEKAKVAAEEKQREEGEKQEKAAAEKAAAEKAAAEKAAAEKAAAEKAAKAAAEEAAYQLKVAAEAAAKKPEKEKKAEKKTEKKAQDAKKAEPVVGKSSSIPLGVDEQVPQAPPPLEFAMGTPATNRPPTKA